jgi:hypothetical protein
LTTDGSGLGVGVPGSGCSGFAAATQGRTTTRTRGFGLLHEWHSPNDSSSSLPPPFLISVRRWMDWGKIPHGRRGSGRGWQSGFIGRRPRVPGLESGQRGCGVGARGGHPRLPTLQGAAAMGPPRCSRRHPAPRHRHGKKAEEGEKDTRKGLTGGVHMAATKRRGGWQAGLSGLKDQLGCC